MAGRGRGRGKTMSFNVEMLGFGRGETLPAPVQQPRPIYPPQIYKPVALKEGEDYEYMLALKQEFRGAAKKSPFYLNYSEKKRDVERYSDKYQLAQQENERKWIPDWRMFPAELKPTTRRKTKSNIKPNLKKARVTERDKEDIVKKLEILETTDSKTEDKDEDEDEKDGEEKKKKDEDGEDVVDEEEVIDDEQLEEETDYGQSYFDNGEGFGDDDDDGDEGPVY
ncbi:DNA-directed RNA polymerase III subunit RPC7-like [Patella vulgata]|uniref:DNA-directed RNA polymerase III subunit RPC7-like n=1 Tax=Patella vulgata TaxID=6465 RepID=UPI00217F62F0|nr:DNA-directed RNA polymerase III subunit RPC7-like [Patella vulgata]